MNKTILTFIAFFGIMGLAACTSPSQSTTEPVSENQPATATSIPTLEASATPEPTATQTPAPSATATQIPPTLVLDPTAWDPGKTDALCEPSDTRTCTILYIFIDQYDDEHVLKLGPTFERAGFTTQVASDTLDEIRGYHECYDFTPANPDMLLEDVDVANYDAIVFIGSDGWSTNLHSDPAAHRIAQQAYEQGKVIAAIGDAPVILARAGLLDGRTVNVKKDVSMHGIGDQFYKAIEMQGAIYTKTSPVRDGLIITADFATPKVAWAIIEVIEEQFP